MSNTNKARILPDLSQLADLVAALQAENAALKATQGSGKEPKAYVAEYTPKKGKNAGKPEMRLFVEGNFFPLVLKQDPCKVMLDNLKTIERFAKTGK